MTSLYRVERDVRHIFCFSGGIKQEMFRTEQNGVDTGILPSCDDVSEWQRAENWPDGHCFQ